MHERLVSCLVHAELLVSRVEPRTLRSLVTSWWASVVEGRTAVRVATSHASWRSVPTSVLSGRATGTWTPLVKRVSLSRPLTLVVVVPRLMVSRLVLPILVPGLMVEVRVPS